MKKEQITMTVSQFARLHEVNKRTLHYYDSIGLFSPRSKGSTNNYRYYDASQSMDFEYIRMLKELNMSIDEIRAYLQNPNEEDFLRIVEEKTGEIDRQIQRLQKTREILQSKKEQIHLCQNLPPDNITLMECPEEAYLTTPFDLEENDLDVVFAHVKKIWGIQQCRLGIGSYISIQKVMEKDFSEYDGLFTPAMDPHSCQEVLIRPAGTYLCGYQKGVWETLPSLYEKMLAFAAQNQLQLTGFAYEMGMNDFVISNNNDYITQIMVKIL